jgi:glycine cleavage system aminomethyltransferase T
MSVDTSPGHGLPTLESVLRHAGGVPVRRDGRAVVAHYGSAAGELAACVSHVGLADRSALTKLELHGAPQQLRELTWQLTGVEVGPGGATLSGRAWWCAESAERMIVLADPRIGERLRCGLEARVSGHAGLALLDHSTDWAALAVVGRRASRLLAELGVYGESGDPRWVAPVTAHAMTGVDVLWLLESDSTALALMPREQATEVWRTIDRAGQAFGISAVGQEAIARYALIRPAAPSL